MNPATPTTTFDLKTIPARKTPVVEARRSYLDTYAKRRSHEATKLAAQHPERVSLQSSVLASIPMQVEMPYVQTSKAPTKKLSPSALRALSRRAIALSRARNVVAQSVVANIPQPEAHIQERENQLTANLESLYKPSLTEQLLKSNSSSASHVRTVVLSALTCGILSLSIFAFLTRVNSMPVVAQPIGAPVIEVEAPASSSTPPGRALPAASVGAPIHTKPTDPVKIVISRLGVNAQVYNVGITAKGEIEVPKAWGLVGWYAKGKTVSEKGPTVLVGHYSGGYGAVFDKLGSLNNGDLITVTTREGKSFTYKVTKKVDYPKDKVPMQSIFKGGSESRLEIITCSGAWQAPTYSNRLVVTAELVK